MAVSALEVSDLERFAESLKSEGLSQGTIDNYTTTLTQLEAYLSNRSRSLPSCTSEDVNQWLIKLDKDGIDAKTRRRHLSAVSKYFDKVKNLKLDVEWPKYRSNIPLWMTKDEWNRLISASNEYGLEYQCLFQLCYDGALRISEALNLKKDDLLFDDKSIRIKLPKSGKYKEEYVPIERETTWGMIKDWLKEKHKKYPNNDYVFPGERSKRLSRSTVDVLIKSICRKAGIDVSKAHAHILRHSRATHLRRDGMEIDELQKFLRHSDIKMTMIYDHIVLDDIRKRLSTLDR